MPEYIDLSKGMKRQQLSSFMRTRRAQASFNVQPKFRKDYNEMRLEQAAHGFGITRYNKKHK